MANSYEENGEITKVISESYIKNVEEIEASKRPHYLNPVDLVFLSYGQMQRGLVFPTKPKNMQFFLRKLEKSLAISLVHFYPLAGQLTTVKPDGEGSSRVYVDCNKGHGARIIHAVAKDVPVKEIVSAVDVPKIIQSFFELGIIAKNYDGHNRPLLSIQVTELSDGLFIGFTMNHSLGDGTSLWHFILSLSEIFDQLTEKEINTISKIDISRKPVFERFFPKGYGPVLKMPHYLDVCRSIDRVDNKVKLRERIFQFSSDSISNLKSKANEENKVQNTISSFQALSAFIWRAITRARKLDDPGLETSCGLVINVRQRINPPVSDNHFGNFLMRGQSMWTVDELLSNGLGWAAMLIHNVVCRQDDKRVCDFYEKLVKFLCMGSMAPFSSPSIVSIGGSTRFDTYGPEFGLGKANAVLLGYCNKLDGKVIASPCREGGGSVDLEVCLNPETMNALEVDDEFMSFVTLV